MLISALSFSLFELFSVYQIENYVSFIPHNPSLLKESEQNSTRRALGSSGGRMATTGSCGHQDYHWGFFDIRQFCSLTPGSGHCNANGSSQLCTGFEQAQSQGAPYWAARVMRGVRIQWQRLLPSPPSCQLILPSLA